MDAHTQAIVDKYNEHYNKEKCIIRLILWKTMIQIMKTNPKLASGSRRLWVIESVWRLEIRIRLEYKLKFFFRWQLLDLKLSSGYSE